MESSPFTWPGSQYMYIMFVVVRSCSCQQIQKFQVQRKTRQCFFDYHEDWKECFYSPCPYLACFSKVFEVLLSTEHQLLIKTADVITLHVCVFLGADSVQSISHWQNECFLCFLKVPNGFFDKLSEHGNSQENSRNVFFFVWWSKIKRIHCIALVVPTNF